MRASLLAALAAIPLSSPASADCANPLYVGAWNIQWLGNANEGKRKDQAPEDIASYITTAKVDVLALEEISAMKDDSGKPRNKPLDAAFAILNSGGKTQWKYVLFGKREGARAPDDQWTGVAWNAERVQIEGEPVKIEMTIDAAKEKEIASRFDKPEENTIIWSRTPYAVKLRAGKGNTDFLIVPVHMKSNIGGKATEDARAYEATLLAEGLKKLQEKDPEKDIIILGDSNMLTSSEAGAKVFLDMGMKDSNARDIGTHITFRKGEKPAPFDRIFLMKDQPETKDSSPETGNGSGQMDFKIVRPAEWRPGIKPSDFRELLSDHMLVRTAICVGPDDD
jgi:predicted extracellular nuclease